MARSDVSMWCQHLLPEISDDISIRRCSIRRVCPTLYTFSVHLLMPSSDFGKPVDGQPVLYKDGLNDMYGHWMNLMAIETDDDQVFLFMHEDGERPFGKPLAFSCYQEAVRYMNNISTIIFSENERASRFR